MADMYIGTPNGVQALGGGVIIPKGSVVLATSRTSAGVSNYQSDELIGKSIIDVNITIQSSSNVTCGAYSLNIRCFNGCCSGRIYSNIYGMEYAYYDNSTGKVSVYIGGFSSDSSATITAFYYE